MDSHELPRIDKCEPEPSEAKCNVMFERKPAMQEPRLSDARSDPETCASACPMVDTDKKSKIDRKGAILRDASTAVRAVTQSGTISGRLACV